MYEVDCRLDYLYHCKQWFCLQYGGAKKVWTEHAQAAGVEAILFREAAVGICQNYGYACSKHVQFLGGLPASLPPVVIAVN